jgi:NADPH:quinone reductase-like Zn-dependent oxidoreductase
MGQVVTRISQADRNRRNLYHHTGEELAVETQKAIQGFTGAAVVMEVKRAHSGDGVFSGFDPNLIQPG